MEPDVQVAEPEPVLAAPGSHADARAFQLSLLAAPATFGVDQARKCVEKTVEIGRDVQAEELEVVADVPDDGEVAG